MNLWCVQLLAPVAQAVAEGEEGGDLRAFGCVQEELESALGVFAAVGAVDGAEAFLQPPGLGEQRLALEELAERAALLLCESFPAFEQAPAGVPEVGAEAAAALLAADRPLAAPVALPLASDRVEGAVGAADEVEGVDHDRHAGQRRPQRLAVGEGRVDRDRLERLALRLG